MAKEFDNNPYGYKRNKDGYFRTTFTARLSDGSKKRVELYDKDPYKLNRKLNKAKLEYEMGLMVVNSNSTVEKWAVEWLETYKVNILDKHYNRYKGIIKNYINPNIGNMKISEVKPIHVQNILNKCADKSKSHISMVKITLRGIFDTAEANDIIVKNPMRNLTIPEGKQGKLRSITPKERAAFIAVSFVHGKGLLFATTLACGLRPGEARALKWENIDFKNGYMSVLNAVESGKKTEKDTKTKSGVRKIPMPIWYMERLKEIKQDKGLIFPSAQTSKNMTEQNYYRAWKSFKRLMDIEMGAKVYRNKVKEGTSVIDENLTPYYLRHTYCTDLAINGVDLKTAQYLMGHSTIAMTANIYTHVTNAMLEKAKKIIQCGKKAGTRKMKLYKPNDQAPLV